MAAPSKALLRGPPRSRRESRRDGRTDGVVARPAKPRSRYENGDGPSASGRPVRTRGGCAAWSGAPLNLNKFCFVIHPLSFDDISRYEPGAAGKGRAIVAKIMEWIPPWAAVHVTGVRTPDGRETEGWFVAAPLLPEQMMEFPREEVYKRIVRAIEIGAELGAQIAGLGAFTGVVGDGGVTIAERSPIPVTTGNSLTIAAGIQSLFRGAREMEIDPASATAAIVGATGSIGGACVQLIAPHV